MQEAQLDIALGHAIEAIRVRFGSQALTRAAELASSAWPSGTALDRLSGIGGLPCGKLSLLTGGGTCGKLTLALSLLAGASREFAHAVVIDTPGSFDPASLVPFDPEPGRVTIVHPPSQEVAGEAVAALARAGAGFILLIGELPEPWIGPVESSANRSGTVLVAVIDSPGRALSHASSLSLGFARAGWIWDRGQLIGLRTFARCLKNRVAPPVGESELEIRYPIGRDLAPPWRPVVERLLAPEGEEGLEEAVICVSAAV